MQSTHDCKGGHLAFVIVFEDDKLQVVVLSVLRIKILK